MLRRYSMRSRDWKYRVEAEHDRYGFEYLLSLRKNDYRFKYQRIKDILQAMGHRIKTREPYEITY